ncbi:MAG: peptide ABC transporter permease, partial [Pseudomonadota bacterium]|nr:peptide ABC transporter permease [Pseudomonadota bacterium]
MLAFILRRAALIVPTFIGVTLLAFALIHLIPGDPVENLSGERGMDPARRERLLREFGLDRPLPVQYAEYIAQVARGDLGTSLTTHEPVLGEFLTLFPATIELAFFAMLFAVALGLPAGILAALKRNTVADYA